MIDNRSEERFHKDLNDLATDIVSSHYKKKLWETVCKKAQKEGKTPEQYWNEMWEKVK